MFTSACKNDGKGTGSWLPVILPFVTDIFSSVYVMGSGETSLKHSAELTETLKKKMKMKLNVCYTEGQLYMS